MDEAVTIRPVAYAEILGAGNARELLEEYAAECALPELGPVNPQAEIYAAIERTGAFQCFGMHLRCGQLRPEGAPADGDGIREEVLVGFASVLVYVVPHYGKRIATVESLFVAAAHRSGRRGNKLMKAVEEHARAQGCVAVLYSAPVRSQLARLLFLLETEYRNSNHVFLKRL